MRAPSRLSAALVLLVFGCDEDPPESQSQGSSGAVSGETDLDSNAADTALEGTAAVIDLMAFEQNELGDDPFADSPDDVQCEFGYGFEDGFFEIETDLCKYGGFVQPSLAPIRVGDTLDFLLLHENLVSDDPDARTHVAIAFGDEIVFETFIDIPAEAAFLDEQWVSTVDAPVGTPVHVHVHNHGINSYRVSELSVTYVSGS